MYSLSPQCNYTCTVWFTTHASTAHTFELVEVSMSTAESTLTLYSEQLLFDRDTASSGSHYS